MQWTLAIGVVVAMPVMGPLVALRHAPVRNRDMTSAQPEDWDADCGLVGGPDLVGVHESNSSTK